MFPEFANRRGVRIATCPTLGSIESLRFILTPERTAIRKQAGQDSQLAVHEASLPFDSGSKMPHQPADRKSVRHFHGQPPVSRQNLFHNVVFDHSRQSLVQAGVKISELPVIESHKMQNCRVQV